MNFLSAHTLQFYLLLIILPRKNNHIPEEKRVLLVIRVVRDLAIVEAKIIARSFNNLVILYFNR
jgi:hypothetical protein